MTDLGQSIIAPMLESMMTQQASDLYLTVGAPPCLRLSERIQPLGEKPLTGPEIDNIVSELLDVAKRAEFQEKLELNLALNWEGKGRFRANFFRQQQQTGVVIRRITTAIPTLEQLLLPKPYADLIMLRRGLVVVAGMTGSGKSTALAAMLGYRNMNGAGHIITIEDPIEYVHTHRRCIFTQREVGMDTESYAMALKNALRQRPDVVLIGEIRDAEVMEQALNFSESGHLVVSTLHANSANQALERMASFFPDDKQPQARRSLATNLRGVLAQRLLPSKTGGRVLAVEILINEGSIPDLLVEGKIRDIKDIMSKSRGQGMQTFDQALLDLYKTGAITEAVALAESDNAANLSLQIRQFQSSDEGAASRGHLNLGMPGFDKQTG